MSVNGLISLFVLEGPVTTLFGIIYALDWEMERGERLLPPPPDDIEMPFEKDSGHTVNIVASGPGYPEELIQQSLMTAILPHRSV